MKKRVISAIFLLLILISTLVISSKLFGILMLGVAILGFNEFFDIKYKKRYQELKYIKILGIIGLILVTLNDTFYTIDTKIVILLPLIFLSLPIVFYNNNRLYTIDDCVFILGIIYFLGFSFNNIIYLREIDITKCIFIFLIAFITDTYAYIGGILIGKHPFTKISPKKTIEGSLIGGLMGVLIGSIYYYNIVGGVSIPMVILLCLVLTIVSELGDLVFSSIKRYFDQKDFSNLIPGHGGILDRFDSVIYVSLGLSIILKMM